MKILLLTLLILTLVACASPYRPVYVSSEGDYYIEEQDTQTSFGSAGSVLYADIGFYPWWITSHYPFSFTYYSPYFYPHYFSIWYPPGYYPFYGYHRGYWASWAPPHRMRWDHYRGHRGRPVASPGPTYPAPGTDPLSDAELRRALYERDLYRAAKDNRKNGYRTGERVQPGTSFKRVPTRPYSSVPAIKAGTPARSARMSPRAAPPSRSYRSSSRPVLRDKD
ncbi:MAG: hypothetical protein HKN57_14300 [Xanthomonadales bacterium]|nr:hypothetical protein [Gammaproteobacteria bacterium]MBT8055097.1 hypothetical protein [Gammaproteobacteria bacterium]NND58414.1 hypothetical protein [Xanthomonadales bacterium]NNK51691.1 hypothetical protein [Xanthomonadales bacterium]